MAPRAQVPPPPPAGSPPPGGGPGGAPPGGAGGGGEAFGEGENDAEDVLTDGDGVDAAGGGDGDVAADQGAVQQPIGAGGGELHPAEVGRALPQVRRHERGGEK